MSGDYLSSPPKIIKSIGRRHFEVELVQFDSGAYRIFALNLKTEAHFESEPITDYALASFMFDQKVLELEGN